MPAHDRALHHVLSEGEQGLDGSAVCPEVGALARDARSEEEGNQLAAPGLLLSLPLGRASDPPQESLSISRSACIGQSTTGFSPEEGRRRRAPYPLSGVQSGRQAAGASRRPSADLSSSHARDHCGAASSLRGSAGNPPLPLDPEALWPPPRTHGPLPSSEEVNTLFSTCPSSPTRQCGSLSAAPSPWSAWVDHCLQSRWPRSESPCQSLAITSMLMPLLKRFAGCFCIWPPNRSRAENVHTGTAS